MKKLITLKIASIILILTGFKIISAETIILQPGGIGKDTYVCDCLPNANNPNGSIIHIYQGQYGACYDRLLIKWDLSSLPKNITITSATMQLKCNSIYGTISGQMVYYRFTEDWVETKVTYARLPKHTNEDSVITNWPIPNKWHSVDITKFVQLWIDDTTKNLGIYGHSAKTTGQCCAEFNSSDASTDSLRPKLIITYTTTSGIRKLDDSHPSRFLLKQNYPNPFNPSTIINYSIPNSEFVSMKIYDNTGREVSDLIQKIQNAGNYEVLFDGSKLASGIYFCRLNAGDLSQTIKLILFR
jgi:hypothetical protein